MVLVDERTKSIALQFAQQTAVAQVDAELKHGVWKLTGKVADHLEQFEARVALVIENLYAQAMAPYGDQAAQKAPEAPASTEPAPGSGVQDIDDDLGPPSGDAADPFK